MGMDAIGVAPTSGVGKWFCCNWWWWRPLSDFVRDVAPDITGACCNWDTNDGDGLNEDGAKWLAAAIRKAAASGKLEGWAKGHGEFIPAVTTGPEEDRMPAHYRVDEHYYFDDETALGFADFLESCGGFELW